MADLNIIRKRLEKYILDSGHTFREISLKIGRKDSYIQQYIKYGFPKRLNEMDRKKVCALLAIDESEMIDDELRQYGVKTRILGKNDVKAEEFTVVDICHFSRDIPVGTEIIGRMALNHQQFGDWLGGSKTSLKLVRVDGDSMEPTISFGSLVFCDTSVNKFIGDGIYAVIVAGAILLKRVQKTAGNRYLLKVDNPHYQDMELPLKEVEIWAKVFGCLQPAKL